jgi:hypothetical protein
MGFPEVFASLISGILIAGKFEFCQLPPSRLLKTTIAVVPCVTALVRPFLRKRILIARAPIPCRVPAFLKNTQFSNIFARPTTCKMNVLWLAFPMQLRRGDGCLQGAVHPRGPLLLFDRSAEKGARLCQGRPATSRGLPKLLGKGRPQKPWQDFGAGQVSKSDNPPQPRHTSTPRNFVAKVDGDDGRHSTDYLANVIVRVG